MICRLKISQFKASPGLFVAAFVQRWTGFLQRFDHVIAVLIVFSSVTDCWICSGGISSFFLVAFDNFLSFFLSYLLVHLHFFHQSLVLYLSILKLLLSPFMLYLTFLFLVNFVHLFFIYFPGSSSTFFFPILPFPLAFILFFISWS